MSTTDSKTLPTDLPADPSAHANNSRNGRESISREKQTKKRSQGPTRRKFPGQAGGATAAVLAVSAIGLEPLTGSRRSTVRAIELSPFTGNRKTRAGQAEDIRKEAAAAEEELGQPVHPTNGDEELYPNRIGNFHKTLPHNSIGEVDPAAYNQFLAALSTGNFNDFETLPRPPGGTAELANPLGGLAFNMEGPDSPAVPLAFMPPPIASRGYAAQSLELYWQAYLRDVPFTDYETNPVVAQACADLTRFVADGSYIGPTDRGVITPQLLFRYDFPGSTVGPMVSQFLYRTFF